MISVLRLNKNSPYLQSLLENILFQSQNSASALSEWWEENKSKISVSAPEDENAVQMMTLHQSKGLEFGTVVVPKLEKIAEIKANKSTVWINGKGIDLDYEHLLINLKKDIIEGDFGKHEIPEISNEVDALELDTINNLYVTFTRAENHLFIFDQPNKLGADFISKNSKEEIFSAGNWVPPETENKESEWAVFENSLVQPDNWRSKIKVSYAAPNIWNVPENSEETIDASDPRKFGNLIHLIFSEINQDFDYHEAIERIKTKGLIESSIENEIESIFNIASKNIELNNIWKSGKHLKEREIIDEKGNILRPDLIIENDSENIILDFKTGEPLEKDQRQIRYYGQQIENIFGKPSKCILYYTGNDNLQYV